MMRKHSLTHLFQAALISIAVAQLAWPSATRADDVQGGGEATTRALCEQLHEVRSRFTLRRRILSVLDAVQARFVPQALVELEESLVSIDGAAPARAATVDPDRPDRVIFSLEPPEEWTRGPEFERKARRHAELMRELKSERRNLQRMAKAGSVEKCVSRADESGFDYARLEALLTELQELRIVDQVRQLKRVRKLVDRAIRRLPGHWQLVRSPDLLDVFSRIRSAGLRHAVIVSHALPDGKLVDPRENEYPLGFFADLAPGLQSLTVFSCHGPKVLKRYGLPAALGGAPSLHSLRAAYDASPRKEILGLGDVVPLEAFPFFAKDLSRKLVGLEAAASPIGAPREEICSVEARNLRVESGSAGLLLNGRFIGGADERKRLTRFEFPCRFLNRGKSVLVLRGLNLKRPLVLESLDFELELTTPAGARPIDSITHYRREDGTYRSSLAVIGPAPSGPSGF